MVTVDDLEEATRAQAPLGTRLEHAGNVEIRCGQRCRNRRVALEELGGQPASLMEPTSRRRTRLRRGESGELPHGCLRCRDGQPGSLEAPPDKVSEGRRQRVAAGRLRRCYTLVHLRRGTLRARPAGELFKFKININNIFKISKFEEHEAGCWARLGPEACSAKSTEFSSRN